MTNLVEYFPQGTVVAERDLQSGIHMRTYERGSGERTAIFLHGFPELALSWRDQLAACPAGMRCVAPDMRGYGGSDAPQRVSAYAMPRLVADIMALADQLGAEKFDLVGHDWGGAVAWEVARAHPTRVRTLSVLNCPPGDLFIRELLRPAQLLKSWYMFFFQLPWVPEKWLTRDPAKQLMAAFRGIAVNRDIFTPEHVALYASIMRDGRVPGINYYRAAIRFPSFAKPPLIRLPTRLIWGLGDGALGEWFANPALYATVAEPFDLVTIAESGHWVQQEAPARVNAALHEHWARH